MRKAIIQIGAFAASILLFSCTDKQLGEPAANNLVQKELTFEANIAEAGTKTSVTMNDSQITGVLWSPSDEINLFFVNSSTALSSGKFSNVAEAPAQTTSFSGTIGVITGTDGSPVADQCFWALYPYAEGNTYTDQTVSFTLSDKQESAANSFSDGQWPTMAKSAGLNLPFYAICSGLKFKVKQEGVKSVTFKTNNGELINGTVVAGWDGNNLPTASISEGTDETVVTPKGGGTFDTSAYYFVTFPAVTMTGGLTVTYKTATQQCIVPKTSSLTFNRNELGTAVDLDNDYVDLPATKYYKASVIEEGYDYLVVSNGYALKNNNGTPAAVEVTDVDNVITLFEEDASILWTAGKPETTITEGTYTFTNDGKSFYRNSGQSRTLLISETPESITKYYLWDYKDNHITHMSSSNYYWIKYEYESSTWSLGIAGTIPSTTNPSYIYTARLPQTLAFTGTEDAEIDLAGEVKTFQATLTGDYHTTVTYSSSDETVATVAADGTVTGHKASSTPVTITATAAGSDTYQSATASYTINVIDSSVTVKYYNKVTEITDGGIYLIVNSDYALDASKSTNYKIAVTPTNDKIEATAELVNAGVKITVEDSKYYLETSSGYLYSNNSDLGFNTTKSTNYQHTPNWRSGTVSLKNNKFLSYSSTYGSSKYRYSSTECKFTLYLLEGSTKPARNLQFEVAKYEKFFGDGNFTNTLSGVTDNVSYSSNKPDIASVNPTTGEVTVGTTAGTATVTASCPETDNYRAESVSFEVKVKDPDATELTFTKVSTLSTGTYLIGTSDTGNPFCDFTALKNSNIFGETTFTIIEDSVTGSEEELAPAIVEIESSSSSWVLKYDDKYLKQDGSGTASTITFVNSISEASVFSYSSNYLKEGTYEFYHSGSGSCYMFKSNKNAGNLVFYKLSE